MSGWDSTRPMWDSSVGCELPVRQRVDLYGLPATGVDLRELNAFAIRPGAVSHR